MDETRENPRFCVAGAGNGGLAMAAHLSLMGFEVSLYDRTAERLNPVQMRGGIDLLTPEMGDMPHGFAAVRVATGDMGEALEGADILMVCVPAFGHAFIAEQCAPHLRDGQIVVLNPGKTGGALEFRNVLNQVGCSADVTIAEAQTFLYASRKHNPAQVRVHGIKNAVPVAALRAYRTVEVVKVLRSAFPQFVPGDNVFKTSLDNIGAIFHPAVVVFNAARIDASDEFQFYVDGITAAVAQALEALDAERVAVSEALGFRAMTAREWLYFAYDAAGRNLYEAMRANPGYRGIAGPITLNVRYLTEDVPYSLVPLASVGEMLGVPTPTIRSVIQLASALLGEDFAATGRTVERLGIAGLTLQEIRRLAVDGGRRELPGRRGTGRANGQAGGHPAPRPAEHAEHAEGDLGRAGPGQVARPAVADPRVGRRALPGPPPAARGSRLPVG